MFETIQNEEYVTIYKANYRRRLKSHSKTHTVQLNSFCEEHLMFYGQLSWQCVMLLHVTYQN